MKRKKIRKKKIMEKKNQTGILQKYDIRELDQEHMKISPPTNEEETKRPNL